jgi:hypothetical protein
VDPMMPSFVLAALRHFWMRSSASSAQQIGGSAHGHD